MSDEGRAAPDGEEARVGAGEGVRSGFVPSPVEREARRADVRKRADHARAQLTTRGMEAVGAQVQENQAAIAALEELTALHEARFDELFSIMAEVASDVPRSASRPHPHLRLVRDDERDAG